MKKYTASDLTPRGCLPSSLFKYFDIRDIRSATDEFVLCMNDIATEFHEKIHAVNRRYSPGKIDLNPRKLFVAACKKFFLAKHDRSGKKVVHLCCIVVMVANVVLKNGLLKSYRI